MQKKVFRMRVVKYFFRSFALVVMMVLLWGGLAHPVYASPANSWTDSLRVSIVDSTVVSLSGVDYLEFKIVVERINEDWNTPPEPDTVLGNSDLYFYADFRAFVGEPVFTHIHDSLSAGTVSSVGGNPDAILQANIGIWAERLHIALTRQDQGNTLIGVPVNPNAKYNLRLAVGKPDTLCTVHWRLATPHSVRLGIKWDGGPGGSTGLQTYGGNPIIETLTGDIEKLPADSLEVDCMPEGLYVCEGGAVAIGMHAESTGKGPIFEWYDSIPGGDRSYPVLASATTQDQTTAGGKRYTYDYRFSAAGDTLYIDKVPNSIDSIYFYCVVSDTTLTTRPSKYCKTRLFVRDSIKGFISPMNSLYTLNKIDTITICPEDSVVSVRFNFFGVTEDELADLDSVYMIYRNDPCNGDILTEDTVGIHMAAVLSEATIDGMEVWYWDTPIKAKRGKVYIQKIASYYCDNAAVAVEYDTIFIKEDNWQMLPRVTVAAKGEVIIDSINSPIFSSSQNYANLELISLRELGTLGKSNYGKKLPFKYIAKDTMGLDTVLYKNVPGRQCAYMREVEVQDLKYLTLKVYLWGAWRSASNSMYAFMGDVSNINKFTNMQDVSGAYFVSPYNSDFKVSTNRLREIIQERNNKGELGFVDWVEVAVVEAEPVPASTVYPFNITRKIDSLSCLLREDGIVCDTAGNPYIGFKNLPQNDYYVVVRHRNHLGIMSNIKIALSSSIPNIGSGVMIDFTSIIAPIAGITNVAYYKPMSVNNYFMYVGDVDSNEKITTADRNKIQLGVNTTMNYYMEDIDFNMRVNTVDINTWGIAKGNIATGYINPTQAFVW